ncbi:DNA adenine methylase [Aliarcobacter butzleri]|uniref:DNA adenine methylase n=1 Tax=Aliarcobacter butzleri TaxID=28197 RepID=UPI002B2469D8|nr:DNA adenine methylase [Aliarcobacter butzleri]
MSYRYIGNKTKLLDNLLFYIQKHLPTGGIVSDLMCGTASVSEMLRKNGYQVISSDIMTYATYHAKVRLLTNIEPSFEKLNLGSYLDVLSYLNNLKPLKGHFYNEYSPEGIPQNGHNSRMYFTVENAMKIDAINTQLNEWESKELLSNLEQAFLRHDLILATNKIANIAGTYGHHRSKWNKSSLTSIYLTKAEICSGYPTEHDVLLGAAEQISHKITADLCYIDPPYMKRQYAANYHILETLARGDSPEAIGKSGLRPWREQYSNFCSKREIRTSFDSIFKNMKCNKFLISYSEDGLLSKKDLVELFENYGEVITYEFNHNRFKSNNSKLSKTIREYLFYIER